MIYRSWHIYAPLPAFIISLLVFIAALIIWIIPDARALFTFKLDVISWLVLTFSVSVFLCIMYYLIQFAVRRHSVWNTLAMLAASLILYFSGAFLLAWTGAAPGANTWLHGGVATLTFFLVYTSVILISIYVFRNDSYLDVVVDALKAAIRWLLKLTYLDCVWAFAYISSAIFLVSIGIGPSISTWLSHPSQMFGYFLFCIHCH